MIPDERGYLWLGTRQGVARASLAELESYSSQSNALPFFHWFTRSDGLRRIDCCPGNQPAATRDRQGRLWFATIDGVAMVDPQRIRLNTNPPPVFIERVRVEDVAKTQKVFSPSRDKPLIIPPGMGEIGIFLSTPSYGASDKIEFAYAIDGLSKGWHDIGGRRSFYLYPPSPGAYKIRLKASNEDGIENESGVALSFVVQPFFWQTGWFWALLLMGCAAGTGGTVWRVLSDKIHRQQDLLLEQQARVNAEEGYRTFVSQSAESIMRLGFHEPLLTSAPIDDQVRVLVECGFVLEANDAAARVRGLNKATDMLNHRVTEFLVWPDRQNQQALRAFVSAGYQGTDILLRGKDIHGNDRYFLNNAAASVDSGQVHYLWAAQRDITERARAEQALHELAQRLMRVQDQERRRIGRELHDSTSQVLAALEISLSRANKHADRMPVPSRENLAECAELAKQCTAQIRTASYLLHPPLLEELGLSSSLHWLVDGFVQRSGIDVELDLPAALPRLGDEYELALFRVVQEALTNVHRHSGSPRARIRLSLGNARLELEIIDYGRGIAPDRFKDLESGRKTLGVGVSGMRERLNQLGGAFQIVSSGSGTRIRVSLAWPKATDTA
jgi:PAS domain S-box-containing protein